MTPNTARTFACLNSGWQSRTGMSGMVSFICETEQRKSPVSQVLPWPELTLSSRYLRKLGQAQPARRRPMLSGYRYPLTSSRTAAACKPPLRNTLQTLYIHWFCHKRSAQEMPKAYVPLSQPSSTAACRQPRISSIHRIHKVSDIPGVNSSSRQLAVRKHLATS